MEQKFGTAVAISERLIHMAYSNRLSPGALDHEALIAVVKYVNDITQNSDMLSFVHKPSDLFLVETSYIYKPEEKSFVLVLHVPLVTPHNLMPLYEFIPLPIHFNFSGNVSVTPEVGTNNMIAVGHSQSYQELSSTDLQACNKMGETYFCKGRNVLMTDLTKTCLGALYLADNKNIHGRCKFSVRGAQEKIFRLDSNTYVVYSLGKISTNHICPKAKTISAVQISSGQTVRINPSCYIRTMDHIITADDSEEITIHSKWLDWTWTLGQLFQQKESTVVASAIAKLRTRLSGKFDAEVLLNELATMSKEAKELAKEVPFNQDLGQIRRRGSPQRTGNHVQGGQGAGQRSPIQSLDLHLPRSNDRSHPSLPLHPVLLLEIVPEQHQRPACSIPDGTSGSANGL